MTKTLYVPGIASQQGKRPEMQDSHTAVAGHGGLFLGVFDGHGEGGEEVSAALANLLPSRFFYWLDEGQDVQGAMTASYRDAEAELARYGAGSTAVTAFVRGQTITVANVGDSEALWIGAKGRRKLTTVHRPSNKSERDRIYKAGAFVEGHYMMGWHDLRGLAMTRAFGDYHLRDVGLNATPALHEQRGEPGWLVLACDGVWDYMPVKAVARIVLESATGQVAAEKIVSAALGLYKSRDNVSAMVLEVP